MSTETEFSPGDVFYTQHDNQYHLRKLLVFDKEFECYHVLAYKPLDNLPDKEALDTLEVFAYHLPINKSGFTDPVLIANTKVVAENLIGYHEYLKQTQIPDYYIPIAGQYYSEGLRLTDEQQLTDAIDAYSKAVDLFPSFYEAIDNRAFCQMDLGLWEEAIEGFEQSLAVNPVSMLAEFSIGECYLNLGDYFKAKTQFEKAIALDPENQIPIDFLQKVNGLITDQWRAS